jgi:hypothetical protein
MSHSLLDFCYVLESEYRTKPIRELYADRKAYQYSRLLTTQHCMQPELGLMLLSGCVVGLQSTKPSKERDEQRLILMMALPFYAELEVEYILGTVRRIFNSVVVTMAPRYFS